MGGWTGEGKDGISWNGTLRAMSLEGNAGLIFKTPTDDFDIVNKTYLTSSLGSYVLKAGDTMTGGLTIQSSSPSLILDDTDGGAAESGKFLLRTKEGSPDGFIISSRDNGDGGWTDRFTILRTGNIGIGTTTPSEKLDIAGNIFVEATGVTADSYKLRFNYKAAASTNLYWENYIDLNGVSPTMVWDFITPTPTTTQVFRLGAQNIASHILVGSTSFNILNDSSNYLSITPGGTGNITFNALGSGGGSFTFSKDVTLATGQDLFLTSGKLGVGTTAVPHSAVGDGMVAIDGSNPYIQMTTTTDNYPIMTLLPFSHDNAALLFDAYLEESTWKSSDAGSNYMIYKNSDFLAIQYESGVSQGSNITWTNAFVLDTSGQIGIGTSSGGATRLEIETPSTWGKEAVIIDQNDADQPFIDWQGTFDNTSPVTEGNLSTYDAGAMSFTANGSFPGSTGWIHTVMIKI